VAIRRRLKHNFFFHIIANNRKRKNYIYSLEINHQTVYDSQEIRQHIQSYYKELIGKEEIRNITLNDNLWDIIDKLSVENSIELELPFTLEEIKRQYLTQIIIKLQDHMVFHSTFIKHFGKQYKLTFTT
jgi:DNA-directed RNA polymerase delta subunit